jgi:hypothetical protein
LIRKSNNSGYRGVFKKKDRWVAQIVANNKRKYLGSFESKKLAAIRYDVEAYLLNDGRPTNFFHAFKLIEEK